MVSTSSEVRKGLGVLQGVSHKLYLTPSKEKPSLVRSPLLEVMMRRFILVLMAVTLTGPALAQDPPEPWGYLYAFRTLRVYALASEDIRIGRLPENQVSLSSTRVSRRHAAIRKTDTGVVFIDIGSSNGSRLNGDPVRAQEERPLRPGDRIQLADELLLYHDTLDSLWLYELRLRLLSGLGMLRIDLPEDRRRKSFGRDRLEAAVTEAQLNPETLSVTLRHSTDVNAETEGGFPADSGAFIGNVSLEDGVLELSLWAISGRGSMTSRRSSISRLKHATLRVSLEEGSSDGGGPGGRGPWFPPHYLEKVIGMATDDKDLTLRFATSLARQEHPEALRDAAEVYYFRYRLAPKDPELLLRAVKAKGSWIDATVTSKRLALTTLEMDELDDELATGRQWLQKAVEAGAKEKAAREAAKALEQAEKRLAAVRESKS